MHILITNDDGIYAPGLKALFDAFKAKYEVSVVAPAHEQSATSHRITIRQPLRAHWTKVADDMKGYAVNGTPADCVKLGLAQLISKKPDWVISGINPGANTGFNVFYSGTAAAAREASALSIPAMAVSIAYCKPIDYSGTAQYVSYILEKISQYVFSSGTFLNVNFPPVPVNQIKGIRLVRQATYHLYEHYVKRTDPQHMNYYWMSDEKMPVTNEQSTDFGALENNYIAITPLSIDTTDDCFFKHMENMGFGR
jgi:5'-nucleotidase